MIKYFLRLTLFVLLLALFFACVGCSSKKPAKNAIADYNRQIERLKQRSSTDSDYIENGSFDVDMEAPRGICVDKKDNIVVVGDRTIQPYTSDGVPKSAILSEYVGYAVAVDSDGRVYVALQDTVHVFEPLGTKKAHWESRGINARLTSISVKGDSVYVADAGNKVILHYDTEGRLLGTIAKGSLVVPSRHLDVFAVGDDKVWVANPGRHTLGLYESGNLIKEWGKTSPSKEGFGGCCNPTDFAVTPDGKFVTAEKGIVRVKLHDKDGNFECVVAGPELFNPSVESLDLAVDSNGRILVLDTHKKSVRVFVRIDKDEL